MVRGRHYSVPNTRARYFDDLYRTAVLDVLVLTAIFVIPQLVPTHQGLVSAHQPVFVPGNLATATGAAAAAGGLVGGAPFSQFHQQALAVASANQPGVAGAQQGERGEGEGERERERENE